MGFLGNSVGTADDLQTIIPPQFYHQTDDGQVVVTTTDGNPIILNEGQYLILEDGLLINGFFGTESPEETPAEPETTTPPYTGPARGFVINGIDAGDRGGFSVSSAGDINNDGFDDIIIGAIVGDPNGNDSGESYVVFGKPTGYSASLELSSLNGTNGFVINGIDEDDYSSVPVSSAGDVNNDGYDDIIIGASNADPNGDSSGESYVVFGQSEFDAYVNLSDLALME